MAEEHLVAGVCLSEERLVVEEDLVRVVLVVVVEVLLVDVGSAEEVGVSEAEVK